MKIKNNFNFWWKGKIEKKNQINKNNREKIKNKIKIIIIKY